MKCAEVIEWMHRYLDHDLSREEITEMFRHIDHCLPCAEIFDRLTMLSRELEKLPDVKPPFSLVDSILPKLDELDRGIVSSEQGGSEDNVIVPFTRPNTQGKRKMGSSMARRTGIGAVAAAIILGVAIFNMPEQIPGAQVEDIMMKSSSNNTAAGGDTAATMKSDAGNAADSADSADSADTANTGSAQNSPVEDSMIMESRIAESGDPATNAPETFIAGTEAAEPSTDSMAGSDSSPEDVLPQTTTGDKTPKQQATSTPPNKKNGSGIQSESSGQNPTGDSNAKRDPEVKASMQPDINREQGMMSLVPESSVPGEMSWTSPDGAYTVALEDQKLVIYNVPDSDKGEEKTAVDSVPLEGKWVSGEWTPDSLHFIYVTHTNGSDVQKVYAVPKAGTPSPESDQDPASTK
jgi:hypothetical protein